MSKHARRVMVSAMSLLCAVGLSGVLSACSASEPYTPPAKDPVISSPVIAENGVLKVGVNSSNPPLAGTLGSGELIGLDVDIAAALADQLGLKVQIIDVGTDAEAALTNGQVDIVMGLDKSNTDLNCWLSDAYLSSGVSLFAASGVEPIPANEEGVSIAAQASTKSAWTVVNEFDKATLVAKENLEDAFAAASSGEAQYVASDAIIGAYLAREKGSNLVIVSLLQQSSGFAIGVLGTNAELQQAISEALVSLQGGGLIPLIQTKWLGQPLDLTAVPVAEPKEAAVEPEATETDEAETEEEAAAEKAPAEEAAA